MMVLCIQGLCNSARLREYYVQVVIIMRTLQASRHSILGQGVRLREDVTQRRKHSRNHPLV